MTIFYIEGKYVEVLCTLYCGHHPEMIDFVYLGHGAHSWLIKTPRKTPTQDNKRQLQG